MDHVCWKHKSIINGLSLPMHALGSKVVEKSWSEWSDYENKKAQNNCITKYIITYALNVDEFYIVY